MKLAPGHIDHDLASLTQCIGCRKGKRECTYPGTSPSSSSKSSRGHLRSKGSLPDSGSSPSGDEDDADEKDLLPAIADDEEEDSEPQSGTSDVPKPSDASFASHGKSTASATDTLSSFQRGSMRPQPTRSSSKHSVKSGISQSSRWRILPEEVKDYLNYHRDHLSHHHYAFKYDGGDFLKTTFLEIAMNDDSQALLYAVIAFAAYHQAVSRGDARISKFLSYYNKSISLLQQSLTKKRHSVATLLTILQLATIEVGRSPAPRAFALTDAWTGVSR